MQYAGNGWGQGGEEGLLTRSWPLWAGGNLSQFASSGGIFTFSEADGDEGAAS